MLRFFERDAAFPHLLHLQSVFRSSTIIDSFNSLNQDLVTAMHPQHAANKCGKASLCTKQMKGQGRKVKQKRLGVTGEHAPFTRRLSRYPLLMSGNYANMSWNGTRTIRHSGCLCIYYK